MRTGRTLLAAAAALSLALVAPGAATANGDAGLEYGAGGVNLFTEEIDVNVVFVGIEPEDLVEGDFTGLADLPTTIDPKIRYKLFYGLDDEADLGLRYSIEYNHVFADDDFESDLLDFLEGIAVEADPTLFQGEEYYSGQENAVELITHNAWIDGPDTEAWLAEKADPLLGVDPTTPTIFFMDVSTIGNHVYVNTDVADPDTDYNFGEIRDSRKMTAWGGTPNGNRVWFYDLSAGPEGWSDNWNVDDADVDGDGVDDYRIPPIWHYTGTPKAYKHPGSDDDAPLADDLAKVTRYVAVNLLFASSPLYPPYFTANTIPETVDLDLNVVDWWKRADVANQFVKPAVIQDGVDTLPAGPDVTVSQAVASLPFSGDWARCYQGFASYNKLCYADAKKGPYDPFANLFLSAARNQGAFLDGSADYEAALIGYGLGNKPKNPQGLLGFADDNWIDGIQSGVFSFVYPDVVAAGYGMTTTMIHEYGHHSSMSHPHDGYDSRTGVDYGPEGETYYAWLGDMSHTIMSYMDLALDFGQFDRDNSARHHAAGYAKIANTIAAANPGPYGAANDSLAAAQAALADHDYAGMLTHAKAAYESVVAVVEDAGGSVEVVEPSTWTLDLSKPGNGPKPAAVPAYARDLDEGHNVKRVYSR